LKPLPSLWGKATPMRAQSLFFPPLASYSRTLYASKRVPFGAVGAAVLVFLLMVFLVGSADCARPEQRGDEDGAAPNRSLWRRVEGGTAWSRVHSLRPAHRAKVSR
jgi:hypothetical protein